MVLKDYIKKLREDSGLYQSDFARPLKVDQGQVSQYETGTSVPGPNTIRLLGEIYNADTDFINSEVLRISSERKAKKMGIRRTSQTVTPDPVTLSLSIRPATIKALPPIPVISLANGGPDGFYDDFGYPVGHGFTSVARPVDVKDENAYGVEVRGESMVPRFEEKDIVVVSPKTSVVSGDYVVLKTSDDEVMVKRIRFTNGMIVLESLNPTFDPIFKKKEEVLFFHKIVWTKHG